MELLDSDLRYALAIQRFGGFTAAARAVGIQQAGLSRAIARLESRLGNELFFRDSRGVRPTPFGTRLLGAAREEEERWGQLLASLKNEEVEPRGRVRVGAHLAIALNHLPTVIAEIAVTYPKIEFEVQIASSREVCRLVESGELDFGIVVQATPLPRLVRTRLENEATYVFSRGSGTETSALLYNPEMVKVEASLKRFAKLRQVPLPSYDLIARTLQCEPALSGILPSSIAERFPGLKRVSPALDNLVLSLIHREDLPKAKLHRVAMAALKKDFGRPK